MPGTPGQPEPVQGWYAAAYMTAYTIEVEDIREAVETLKSRGVSFDTDVLEFPWGSVAPFQDPRRQPADAARRPVAT
jgi:hypothetical protein